MLRFNFPALLISGHFLNLDDSVSQNFAVLTLQAHKSQHAAYLEAHQYSLEFTIFLAGAVK